MTSAGGVLRIERSEVAGDERLQRLVGEHLDDMYATSPPESVHALDTSALADSTVTVWLVLDDDDVVGCGALKELDAATGEIKSMRTTAAARGRGIGAAMLEHLITEARTRGWTRLFLETGSQEFFAPARRMYARRGFVECGPFGDYALDPHSTFMTLELG